MGASQRALILVVCVQQYVIHWENPASWLQENQGSLLSQEKVRIIAGHLDEDAQKQMGHAEWSHYQLVALSMLGKPMDEQC